MDTRRCLRRAPAILLVAHGAILAGAAEKADASSRSGAQADARVPASASAPGKPLSASLGVVVYPSKAQTAAKQSQDEFECYNWAKESTGYDPIAPPTQQAAVPESRSGGRVRGAVRGAAAGAAIGEVASNDAGTGAGVGAVAGALHGGQQQRREQQAARVQAEAKAEDAKQAQLNGFKKGFSACLQGRGYSAVM